MRLGSAFIKERTHARRRLHRTVPRRLRRTRADGPRLLAGRIRRRLLPQFLPAGVPPLPFRPHPRGQEGYLLAAYKDGEIVAFLANLPQTLPFPRQDLRRRLQLPPRRPDRNTSGRVLGPVSSGRRSKPTEEVQPRFLSPDPRDRAPLDADDEQAHAPRATGSRRSASPASWPASSTSTGSPRPRASKATKKRPSALLGGHRPPKPAPGVDPRDYRPGGPRRLPRPPRSLSRIRSIWRLPGTRKTWPSSSTGPTSPGRWSGKRTAASRP